MPNFGAITEVMELSGYNAIMKPLPPPEVPGKTEFERFDNAVRQVLTVSKEELLRREADEKRAKGTTDKLDRK
jgi:hypothetical protein